MLDEPEGIHPVDRIEDEFGVFGRLVLAVQLDRGVEDCHPDCLAFVAAERQPVTEGELGILALLVDGDDRLRFCYPRVGYGDFVACVGVLDANW